MTAGTSGPMSGQTPEAFDVRADADEGTLVIRRRRAEGAAGSATALLADATEVTVDALDGSVVEVSALLPVDQPALRVLDGILGEAVRHQLLADPHPSTIEAPVLPSNAVVAASVHRLALISRLRAEGYPVPEFSLATQVWRPTADLPTERVTTGRFLSVDAATEMLHLGELADEEELEGELEAAVPALALLAQTVQWYSIEGDHRLVARECIRRLEDEPGIDVVRAVLGTEDSATITGLEESSLARTAVAAPLRSRHPGAEPGAGEVLLSRHSLDPRRVRTDVIAPAERSILVTWTPGAYGTTAVDIAVPLRDTPADSPGDVAERFRALADRLELVARVVRRTDGAILAVLPLRTTPRAAPDEPDHLEGSAVLEGAPAPEELVVEVQAGDRGPTIVGAVLNQLVPEGSDPDEEQRRFALLRAELSGRAIRLGWRALTLFRLARHPAATADPGLLRWLERRAAEEWQNASYDWEDAVRQCGSLLSGQEQAAFLARQAAARALSHTSAVALVAEGALRPLLAEQVASVIRPPERQLLSDGPPP